MLHQLALEAGKKRLSAQTSFVHQGDFIPVVDNFLYALALMRTRVADRVLEARDLLERLLPFQTESGLFPINLHEWPNCNDPTIGVQLLVPIHWMLKEFGAVLGSDLQERLTRTQKLLQQQLKQFQTEKKASDFTSFKIDACLSGAQPLPENGWLIHVPKNLGEILAISQISDTSLGTFLPYLSQITHPATHLYSGPPVNEFQDGTEPETTLFDLYIAALTGKIPERVKKDHPIHLWAAVIEPFTTEWKPAGVDFSHYQGTVNESRYKGLHHFRYQWGELTQPHSMVCQGGNFNVWKLDTHGNRFDFEFNLESYDFENERDLIIYFNYQPAIFTINGVPANTFNLGDAVQVKTNDKTFDFKFIGEKGLVGHIMRGNRLSQIAAKGDQRYAAYDWVLFLRSVRRPVPYKLNLQLTIT